MNSHPVLLPGDVCLTTSTGWLARAILWFEALQSRRRPEPTPHAPRPWAEWSHAMGALGDLAPAPAVIESHLRVRVTPLAQFEGQPLRIWRLRTIGLVQRRWIAARWLAHSRRWYAGLKLPLLALDAVFGTIHFSTRWRLTHLMVCSGLIARGYEEVLGVERTFGLPWESTTPDAIDDYCRSHYADWELVHEASPATLPFPRS